MNFYPLCEVAVQRSDLVCRQSRLKKAIPVVVLAVLAASCLCLVHSDPDGRHMPPWLPYYLAAVLALFAFLFTFPLRASFHSANWIMRCTASGIVIKYRSYLNRNMPADDVQVVSFNFSELAWVRIAKEVHRLPESLRGSDQHVTTRFWTYLELQLVNHDTTLLEERLREERNREKPGRGARWLDYPLTVLDGGIVRIRWNGITPSAVQMLRLLSRFVSVAPEARSSIDFNDLRTRSPKEQRAAILRVAQGGNEFAAETMAVILYGYSLGEATKFVRDLLHTAVSSDMPS